MHNKGLFDEYKDVQIEENPGEHRLITLNDLLRPHRHASAIVNCIGRCQNR
jgi:hypothetical protein